MMRLPKNEGLNIVPFIDIMLVLLAIVLSVSTFIAQGQIKINLPKSETAISVEMNDDKLSLNIDELNKFYINDKEVSIEDMKTRLNKINKETLIELRSDKNAKFESFIAIIDILKMNNHEKFQIITEKER